MKCCDFRIGIEYDDGVFTVKSKKMAVFSSKMGEIESLEFSGSGDSIGAAVGNLREAVEIDLTKRVVDFRKLADTHLIKLKDQVGEWRDFFDAMKEKLESEVAKNQ
jgi:hypothetical protein